MLNFLSDHLAIVLLLVLTLLAVLLLAAIVWAAGQGARAQEEGTAAPVAPRLKLDSLKQSFRRAVELVEAHLATRAQRYDLAWTLVLNEGEGELPLAASGIPSALSADAAMSAQALGISWNFFDKGLAVQLQGAALGTAEDAAHGTQVWDELLGLCRHYRPDRPLDAIVVTLPARLLMPQHPQDQLDLAARARAVHRRLWLAQNRFALQFPVYLVVRGCEDIPCFARFARALPEPMRRSMLGWSSPFELSAPFQAAWLDAGMDDVTRDVQDACAELCAMELPGSDSAGYFMLPAELDRLRPGLRLFMEELMRPSAYHEPFVLRGFYFAGDCSDAAVLRAAGSGWPQAQGPALPAPQAGGGLAPLDALPPALVVPGLSSALEPEPAFLREVFEKKVFAETGLVRASRTQRTSRPALGRLVRWTAVAVPAAWVLGLVVAGVRLHHVSDDMVAAVRQLDREARLPTGDKPGDPARDRERALAALLLMERVDAGALGSVFMPGSWEGIDELHARLRQRLDRGFGDNALEPIRLGAYARIAELTGVPLDAASGRLIEGAACALPAGWQARVGEAAPAALNPEEVPEFAALLQFVARAEELDQAVRAMDRLATGREPPQAEDLRRVVRSFLDAELAGSPARAAAVLRGQARRSAPLAVDPMRRATACSFGLATRALHERIFARNALLLSQQDIAVRLQRLKENAEPAAWTDLWQQWHGLLGVLRRQEALLGPGKGGWMRAPSLQAGAAWDGLLQRAQGLALVGREPVAAARAQAQADFSVMRAQWERLLPEAVGAPDAGLRWLDKDKRWVFTEERAALQAALAQLASEPFLRAVGEDLPQVPTGASVAWDKARLDQALQVGDIRKRFQTEQLPRFPVSVRQEIELVVQAALADAMVAQLAQAAIVLPRSGAAPRSTEAERLKLARARVLLEELGATSEAEQLAALQARDALARLKSLDEGFAQAAIYQPRDAGFRDWQGEKGPLAIAFGAGDATGLAAYAAQQQAFIDESAREAESLLQMVDGGGGGDVARRWRAVVADVARYRLKSPASSLGVLEQFVVKGTSELDLSNCAEKLPVSPRHGSDPFAERLGALQGALAGRCRELRSAANRDAWSRFAQAFNRELAGRAPFRPVSAVGERPPADVEDAAAVLKTFAQAQHLLGERAGASASVRRFGEQMERVRAFMAPLFPADEAAASGYDLSVEFRANASREVEGNKIIEWQLTVGTQTLRQHEAPRPLRWEPGQPVVVTLRLAKDAPVVPRPDPSQPAMTVQERTVRFRFDDPWALYTLIATRREPEGSARQDARSQLLRLDFPLAPADDKAAPQPERATVFLRLGLSAVGKRNLLAWPGGFPARAPEWGTP